MNDELAASYRRCRRLLVEHGRTYSLATRLLPPQTRPAVWALYGFARYVDDLVDVDLDAAPEPALLDALRDQLLRGLDAGHSSHPVLGATVDTIVRYGIERQWLLDFLDSMRMDLTPQQFDTWHDLRRYTWGSAAVIGLQMARVLGVRGDVARAEECAAALGEAFQITNFCRDYDEDRARGRVYLPTELFTRAGAQPGTGEPDAVRAVIADAAAYARKLYAVAEPGIDLLRVEGQPCIRAAFELYRGILDEIEAADYRVIGVRHRVGQLTRMRVAGPLLVRSLALRARTKVRPQAQHREH